MYRIIVSCSRKGKLEVPFFCYYLFQTDWWICGLCDQSTYSDVYFMARVINYVFELNEKQGARVFSSPCGEVNTCSSDCAGEKEGAMVWKKKMWWIKWKELNSCRPGEMWMILFHLFGVIFITPSVFCFHFPILQRKEETLFFSIQLQYSDINTIVCFFFCSVDE